mmetsp:Transcript_14904/g.21980  ORF Transcript_14904/g.21980 Transcript_14904/m.21980 type:complete len:230 (-) Transcript_14904:209-898(-)
MKASIDQLTSLAEFLPGDLTITISIEELKDSLQLPSVDIQGVGHFLPKTVIKSIFMLIIATQKYIVVYFASVDSMAVNNHRNKWPPQNHKTSGLLHARLPLIEGDFAGVIRVPFVESILKLHALVNHQIQKIELRLGGGRQHVVPHILRAVLVDSVVEGMGLGQRPIRLPGHLVCALRLLQGELEVAGVVVPLAVVGGGENGAHQAFILTLKRLLPPVTNTLVRAYHHV